MPFALEGCRHVTRRLKSELLAARCTVIRVAVHLMATARRSGHQRGKSDPIDALAVAHACLREPGLPGARLDGPAREVKLLSDHRHNLVTERTNSATGCAGICMSSIPACRSVPAVCAATACWVTSPCAWQRSTA